jgi:EAL domain-containing protein (putative c-di-GMP-specific phosphodiesterase class I)
VAEGVETAEDAEILREAAVDFLQGHHFGRASLEPPWLRQ